MSVDKLKGSRLVTLAEDEFLQAMFGSALAALADGAALEVVHGTRSWHVDEARRLVVDTRGERVAALRAEIRQLRSSARQARAEVVRAPVEMKDDYRADAELYTRRAVALQDELDRLAAVTNGPVNEPFETDGAYVARALAYLATARGHVEAAVCDAVETIVDSMRLVELAARHAEFEWWMRLPASNGVLRFGPLRFRVRHATPLVRQLRPAIDRFLATVPGLECFEASTVAHRRQVATAELTARGVPHPNAVLLGTCPIPEVIDIVTSRLCGTELPDVDPSFVEKVVDTYLGGQVTSWGIHYVGDNAPRQAIIDLIVAGGGEATLDEIADSMERLGFVRSAALTKTKTKAGPRGPVRPVTQELVGYGRTRKAPQLVVCMHCGHPADLAVMVPEVPDCLLCTRCWRQPRIEDSAVYPESYGMLRAPRVDVTQLRRRDEAA